MLLDYKSLSAFHHVNLSLIEVLLKVFCLFLCEFISRQINIFSLNFFVSFFSILSYVKMLTLIF